MQDSQNPAPATQNAPSTCPACQYTRIKMSPSYTLLLMCCCTHYMDFDSLLHRFCFSRMSGNQHLVASVGSSCPQHAYDDNSLVWVDVCIQHPMPQHAHPFACHQFLRSINPLSSKRHCCHSTFSERLYHGYWLCSHRRHALLVPLSHHHVQM